MVTFKGGGQAMRSLVLLKLKFKSWMKTQKRIRLIKKNSRKRWREAMNNETLPDTTMEEDAECLYKGHFGFDMDDCRKIAQWQRTHKCRYRAKGGIQYFGAFGGGYGYYFVPTSMGMEATVTCACGAELDLSSFS